MLYKISEFSSITKISARMLRYLDHEGILKPNVVHDNGYRYYSDAEMVIATHIIKLRRYHFSYQEIKEIFDKHLENEIDLYRQKVASLKEVAENYEVLIRDLENLFEPEKTKILNQYDIQSQSRKPYYALAKRCHIHADELEHFIENSINAIFSRCDCAILGSYYVDFFNDDLLDEGYSTEEILDVCFVQPVAESTHISGFETIMCDEALVLSTIHYGGYDQIYNAYLSLFHYTKKEGYVCVGPYSEKYFVDSYLTVNPQEYITEVSIIVTKLT